MIRRFLTLTIALLTICSCVHVRSVSLTQIPEKRSNKISSTSEKWIFFFLNFDNDFVDKIGEDLKEKCPGGKVQGILTKDEMADYFIGFVMKRKITATGYCSKA